MRNAKNVTPLDGAVCSCSEEDLPHLHGFPWYKWAKRFFESRADQNFLCAANQISKSSTMIRKCIEWATNKELWPDLWATTPTQFWYFYPDKSTATREFDEKWIKEFLPKVKNCPRHGWNAHYEYKKIHHVSFHSGLTVYFLSYEQQLTNIQSSSVYAMFCDEEAPVGVYDECAPRVWATDGYFHMAFTATIGQEFWRQVIEEKGEKERFPDALKIQVAMWDCMEYEDGSASPWTEERIKKREASCRTEAERLRRIYGRFILSSNRLFSAFEPTEHTISKSISKAGWRTFCGVFGNAIILVRVNPSFDLAEVFDGHIFEDRDVSALQIYLKYRKMVEKVGEHYSYADKKRCRDFITVAASGGSPFTPVRKTKDNGEKLLNSLFETRILRVAKRKALSPLIGEITSVKRSDEDLEGYDFVGALVTCVTSLPWDFKSVFIKKKPKVDPYEGMDERERWHKGLDRPITNPYSYDQEIQEINEAHDINDDYQGIY